MKAKIVISAVFLAVGVSLFAQEAEEKMTYSNITEFGLLTASPRGVSIEGTTAHGFAFNKQHLFGLGVGIGINFHNVRYLGYDDLNFSAYMPLFVNYRYYFKPQKTFSPHVNVALGGLLLKDNAGMYSSVTMGFRAGKFSFSSGISFMAMQMEVFEYDDYYYEPYYYGRVSHSVWKWHYPFGITLKCGFSF